VKREDFNPGTPLHEPQCGQCKGNGILYRAGLKILARSSGRGVPVEH
jgi:hypothetical protein